MVKTTRKTNTQKQTEQIQAQQEVINALTQEIKALQEYVTGLGKTLGEHAENMQFILNKTNKNTQIAEKNAEDIYNLKIKEGLHSDLLDRAKPIIDIADPLTKQGFRIRTLETKLEALQENMKDFNIQDVVELKETTKANTDCVSELQTDSLLQGQMIADLRLEIERIKQKEALQDKQIQALQHEASKSVWEKLFK